MTDFLLELRSEEIPARMQVKAKDDLARLFAEEIAKAGLVADRIEAFATPRRLALIAYGLPDATQAVSEERKGPRANAPDAALAGFLRSTGLTRDQLVERDGVFFAVIDKPGRPTADVLAEAIPAVIRAFPWPKSMRWGTASISTESLRWVRPLQGIVALLGDDVVACAIDGIVSGRETTGHRFHHNGPVSIANAGAYIESLRAAHVIVHLSERVALIRDGATAAAAKAGLSLVPDEPLIVENAGLTEWPVPLLGRFDAAFLNVPREVIQLTMRTNQKYFACVDGAGALANAFVCTANIDASDGGKAVIAGNEKVLSARLSDAKFFWEADLKVRLEDQAAKLSQIVFHEKLGTVADKVERVAKLAAWLAVENIVRDCDPALARKAAELCKADLVTGMVGEFPELQGIMGGYYARAQGYPDAVADAIRDHYKPVGQGDDVPTAPVTVAVSLADKLDTVCCFFRIEQWPTGSKDPFAIRRAALAVIRLINENMLVLNLTKLFRGVVATLDSQMPIEALGRGTERGDGFGGGLDGLPFFILDFFADRLKVQQREAGVRHDLIDAVFALGGEDDLVRLLARVKALQGFVTTDAGKNLLSGYKRAANILKKEGAAPAQSRHPGLDPGSTPQPVAPSPVAPWTPDQVRGDGGGVPADAPPRAAPDADNPLSYTPEIAETALIDALDVAEPRAAAAIEKEAFETAMSALASLRAPIDAFFETVTVNDADPAKRTARLALLARFRDAVHRVADFSKIDG